MRVSTLVLRFVLQNLHIFLRSRSVSVVFALSECVLFFTRNELVAFLFVEQRVFSREEQFFEIINRERQFFLFSR